MLLLLYWWVTQGDCRSLLLVPDVLQPLIIGAHQSQQIDVRTAAS